MSQAPALIMRDVVGRTLADARKASPAISLSLAPGECGVVLGGKETFELFRLVMGTGRIESGEIVIGGQIDGDQRLGARVDAAALSRWRQHIGFAFREKGLLSNLTTFENVDLPAKYHGRYATSTPRGTFAEAALRELEADEASWHVRPNRISWEVRKKAFFARAVVLDPPVLVLDDPSALVASSWLPFLLKWIRLQLAKGRAILIGTNDYAFGVAVADWMIHPTTALPVTKYDDFIRPSWLEMGRILRAEADLA